MGRIPLSTSHVCAGISVALNLNSSFGFETVLCQSAGLKMQVYVALYLEVH